MKQLFTFVMALFLFSGVGYARIAQSGNVSTEATRKKKADTPAESTAEPLFTEGFDHGTSALPTNWTQIDLGGSRHWDVNAGTPASPGGGSAARHMGGNYSSALISPEITLPDGSCQLEFYSRMAGYTYDANAYKVMVSTTGNDDIKKFVEIKALSLKEVSPEDTWTEIAVSLKTYAGQAIHLAFVYNGLGTYASAWFIDDVVIQETPEAWEDFLENFDHGTTALPTNWTQIDLGGSRHWDVNAGTPASPGGGSAARHMGGNYSSALISPEITLPDGSYQLEFHSRMAGYTYDANAYKVMVSTTGNDDIKKFVEIKALSLKEVSPEDTWTKIAVSLETYAGQAIHLAFVYNGLGTYASAWFIDDVTIQKGEEVEPDEWEDFLASFENDTEVKAWSQLQIAGTGEWKLNEYNAPSGNGSHSIKIEGVTGNKTALVSPAIKLVNTDKFYALAFYSSIRNAAGMERADIMLSTTGNDDISKFTSIKTLAKDSPETPNNAWAAIKRISLDAYKGKTIHLAFVHEGTNTWWIDGVKVTRTETFPEPDAITAFPWTESFNTGWQAGMTENWDILNISGDQAWKWNDHTMAYDNENAHGGCVVHSWMANEQKTALITPPISVPSGARGYQLEFWSYTEDASAIGANASAKIMASTTGRDNIEKFSTELKSLTGEDVLEKTWKKIVVPLDAYSGQTITLAFYYQGNNAHRWIVDEVTIKKQPLAAITTLPWAEEFATAATLDNWDIKRFRGGTTGATWKHNTSFSGTNAGHSDVYGVTDALLSAPIDIPATGEFELRFTTRVSIGSRIINDTLFRVMIATNDGELFSDYTSVFNFKESEKTERNAVWKTDSIDISDYAGQQIRVAIVYATGASNAYTVNVDGISIKQLEGSEEPSAFPWLETFDDMYNFPPAGWTQINVSGSMWQRSEINHGCSDPLSPGALRQGNSSGALVTPAISIPDSDNSYELSLDTRFLWAYENEVCKILISKTNASSLDEFELLYELKDEDLTTLNCHPIQPISLDGYKGETIYLAFMYESGSARWLIDNVLITERRTTPYFEGETTVDLGEVPNNVELPVSKTYTITNAGTVDLTVSSLASATNGISVTGLPQTISNGQSKDITVTLNAFEAHLPDGAYSGNFVLSTNDPRGNITIEVTANITASSSFFEDFNDALKLENGLLPKNWTKINNTLARRENDGLDSSGCLRFNIYSDEENNPTSASGEIKTTWHDMGTNPQFSYYLKAWDVERNAAARANETSYYMLISEDGTKWDTVKAVKKGEHIPSADFVLMNANVSNYANKVCMMRFLFKSHGSKSDIYYYIDNITIGTPRINDLEAAFINGPTLVVAGTPHKYEITVRNLGTATQTANDYSVALTTDGGIEVATIEGVSIEYGRSKTFDLLLTPATTGVTNVSGRVIFANDEMTTNNTTTPLRVDVLPDTYAMLPVGIGEEANNAPFDFSTRYGLTQTLYYPQEIGTNGGKISGLIYKSTGFKSTMTKTVKIYLGETTLQDLEDGWVAPNTLQLVYDGSVDFKAGNGSDVLVQLTTPYEYKGGTLVVYTYRDDAFMEGGRFYSSKDAGKARTRCKYPNLNPQNPLTDAVDGYPFEYYPNVTFLLDVTNIGSVSGTISDANGALEGVKVQLVGGNLSKTTDAQGKYEFPFLTAGAHQLEMSKFAYYTETPDITVTAGDNTVKDVTMTLLPKYTVSGKVTGSNAPGGLKDVTITLEGYENYSATTDAAGNYSIPEVYDAKTYNLTAEIEGYIIYTASLSVNGSNVAHNINLLEIPYAPSSATLHVEDNSAVVNWQPPVASTLFRYEGGNLTGNCGFRDGDRYGVMGAVHRVNAQLTSMSWYTLEQIPNAAPREVNIFVFALSETGVPTNTILFNQDNVPTNINEWTHFDFPELIVAPHGFFIALSRNQGHAHIGTAKPTDEWPFIPQTHYYGDYRYNNFYPVEGGNLIINMAIRATGSSFGEPMAFGYPTAEATRDVPTLSNEIKDKLVYNEYPAKTEQTPAVAFAQAPAPVPQSYTVYRLEEGAEEASWTQVADKLTTPSYTDATWSALEDSKAYQYAIKAVYTGENNRSKPALTNSFNKGLDVSYTVQVSTNTDSPVTGAIVTLTHQNGNTEFVYTKKLVDNTVIFPQIRKGTYELSIVLRGFDAYVASNIEINAAGLSHTAVLQEYIADPFGLEIDVAGPAATLTWNNAPVSFSDDMESYQDFIIKGIGDYTMVDLDGAMTHTWSQVSFENEGYTGSFIVMNPSATEPAAIGCDAHSGSKYLACFSAKDVPNNDWLILPRLQIVAGAKMEFWARSLTSDYGLEKFKVWISTSGIHAPTDFIQISAGSYLEAPVEWTKFSFDLSGYAGQNVYLAINDVSDQTFALFVDDIFVGVPEEKSQSMHHSRGFSGYTVYLNGVEKATDIAETEYTFENLANGNYVAGVQAVYTTGVSMLETIDFTITDGVGVTINNKEVLTIYPNPVAEALNIVTESTITKIALFDQNGKMVKHLQGHHQIVDVQSLPTGHYIVRIHTMEGVMTAKIVKQ